MILNPNMNMSSIQTAEGKGAPTLSNHDAAGTSGYKSETPPKRLIYLTEQIIYRTL